MEDGWNFVGLAHLPKDVHVYMQRLLINCCPVEFLESQGTSNYDLMGVP